MFEYSPNIALHVVCREEALKFYTEVLNMKLISRHEGESIGYELKSGPITFWLEEKTDPKTRDVWFEFVVKDLDFAAKLVKAHGCRSGGATSGKTFRGQHFTDPFGMSFHLYQSLKVEGL